MTCITESLTVCADAPLYVAAIETRGGAMSGYCSKGRLLMDKMPKKTMNIANTQANTGRLMKNKAMVYTVDYLTGMKNEEAANTRLWFTTL